MIRINLLPDAKRGAARSAGSGGLQGWLIGYAVTAVLTGVICAVAFVRYSQDLKEQAAQNQQLNDEIETIKQQSADLDALKDSLKKSDELAEVVGELERARYGPTKVLLEIARILSRKGGPTIDPEELESQRATNPLAGFNPAWDAYRLWLTSFAETNRECRITGHGKTNEDVAEFLRRLTLSEYFTDVALVKTEAVEDRDSRLPVIAFEINAKVTY